MNAIYSSRTADKFVVRLPDGMREQIAAVAKISHRSMNSEIIARLSDSLDGIATPSPTAEKSVALDALWIPQVGQLVTTPHGTVRTIDGFMIYEDGSIEAVFNGFTDKYLALESLKPFVVKR